jgi:eukaryotic-like serine/threonine-protein kinase
VTLLAGRYELRDALGTGAMGRVLVANDRVLGRDVAVKLLGGAPDEVTRERFLREARAAARLHHPNAVAVYDTGEDDGQPYIVMELVRGGSLADLLRREGQLEIDTAVAITLGVLEGLAAAHAAGMIHRDVKPANVLLPSEGGVKLSDFGIAKAVDEAAPALTATGSVLGTPTYLAPELVGGHPPSPASDVYSVGCLLYAMLAGDPPFIQGDPLAIAYAHRHDPVPPIDTHRPDLPEDLTAVLDRALTKDPEQRYTTAEEMRTALVAGPEAVPAAGAGAAAATAALPADRTAVLPDEGADTRALDPTASTPAPATATPTVTAPPAAPRPPTGRTRWVGPAVVVLGLLAAGLLLWWLLGGLGAGPDGLDDDAPTDADTEVDAPEEAEPETEADPPATDETPSGDTESPADEAPGQQETDEEAPADPPADAPTDEPPADAPPTDAPPEETPPGGEPTDGGADSASDGPADADRDTPTETQSGSTPAAPSGA